MRPSSIRDILRAEPSLAAFEAVIRYGLRGTTIDKVGEVAGVSKGVVLHQFKDKSALLEAAFRRPNCLLSRPVVELHRHAETFHERFWSIVVANFLETIFNRRVRQAWVSLISEVPHSTQCQRVQNACSERARSNLQHELKNFLPPEDAMRAARQLGVLIDGFWVRAVVRPDQISSDAAISEIEFAVSKLLPGVGADGDWHCKALERVKTVATIVLGSRAFREPAQQV